MSDVRFAFRQLARSPGFTAVAVLTLGLGIGASTAIFSVVDAVLLRPLPYPRPERLVALGEGNPRFSESFVRPDSFRAWRGQATTLAAVALLSEDSMNLAGGGAPVRAYVGRTTAELFPVLGVRPALGRDFARADEQAGAAAVVILSHGFWQRRFGGRPGLVGQAIELDARPHTVVGVLPRGFALERPFDLYTPLALSPRRDQSANHYVTALGRLRDGATVAQAQQEVAVITARLAAQEPRGYRDWRVTVQPLLEARVAAARPALFALVGAVGLLLLIACANVANLLLVRSGVRARELAVRAALGAGRGRLRRQLLTESLVLALAGAAAGLLVAWLGLPALLAFAPEALPRAGEATALDGRALLFTCATALATSVAFGLAPALRLARVAPHQALQQGGRAAGEGPGARRLRSGVVVAELAVAMVLLVGAGLLFRSFVRLAQVDRGFQPDGAVAVSVTLPERRYDTDARRVAFADGLLARLEALPGVEAVGAAQRLPFAGGLNLIRWTVVGRPPPPDPPVMKLYAVTGGYFRAMGIPLVAGRRFDTRDRAGAPLVVIINQALARRHFPGQDPLGQRLAAAHAPHMAGEIVGVVGDVRDDGLAGEVAPQGYVSLAQDSYLALTFVVRARGTEIPAGWPAAIGAAVAAVDGDQPVAGLRPLRDLVAASIARQRFAMFVFAVFSGAALLLAALGLGGVMAHGVAQRRREIGVRLALGAQAGDIQRLVLRQGGVLVALGLLAGGAGALLAAGLLDRLLFGVQARDPGTFAAMAVVLALVALAACALPAHWASRIDPMQALRME
jgi:putative ABC transport system permease protein